MNVRSTLPTSRSIVLVLVVLVQLVALPALADDWGLASDIGAYGLVLTSLAVPALDEDGSGVGQAALGVGVASAVGLVGKVLIDAERPDGSSLDSFPSNHTANAFAAATTLMIRQDSAWAYPALAVAAIVGVGRVKADRHHVRDVIAGAVLGSLSGWVFTREREDEDGATGGWSFSITVPLG